MTLAGLAVAGAVGALLRHLVDRQVQRRSGSSFPVGILVVNLSGSLVLGVLVGSELHHGITSTWLTVLGTGLLGAYTTFSTFAFDMVHLLESQEWGPSAINAVVSLAGGIGLAAAGLALGSIA